METLRIKIADSKNHVQRSFTVVNNEDETISCLQLDLFGKHVNLRSKKLKAKDSF